MKENIFTYEGPRGELVEKFYELLITGETISYEKILTEYDGGKLLAQNVTGTGGRSGMGNYILYIRYSALFFSNHAR